MFFSSERKKRLSLFLVPLLLFCGLITACNQDGPQDVKSSTLTEVNATVLGIGNEPIVADCFDYAYSLDNFIQAVAVAEKDEREEYGAVAAINGVNPITFSYAAVAKYSSELDQYARLTKGSCRQAINYLRSAASEVHGYEDVSRTIVNCADGISDIMSVIDEVPADLVKSWPDKKSKVLACPDSIYEAASAHGLKFVKRVDNSKDDSRTEKDIPTEAPLSDAPLNTSTPVPQAPANDAPDNLDGVSSTLSDQRQKNNDLIPDARSTLSPSEDSMAAAECERRKSEYLQENPAELERITLRKNLSANDWNKIGPYFARAKSIFRSNLINIETASSNDRCIAAVQDGLVAVQRAMDELRSVP